MKPFDGSFAFILSLPIDLVFWSFVWPVIASMLELIVHISSALWFLLYVEGTLDLWLYGKEHSLWFVEICAQYQVKIVDGTYVINDKALSPELKLHVLEWLEEVSNYNPKGVHKLL